MQTALKGSTTNLFFDDGNDNFIYTGGWDFFVTNK